MMGMKKVLLAAQMKMVQTMLSAWSGDEEKYGPELVTEMQRIRDRICDALRINSNGDKRGALRIRNQALRDMAALTRRCKAIDDKAT